MDRRSNKEGIPSGKFLFGIVFLTRNFCGKQKKDNQHKADYQSI